jgi:hypothetical protein
MEGQAGMRAALAWSRAVTVALILPLAASAQPRSFEECDTAPEAVSTLWLARCVHGLLPAEESRLSQALDHAHRSLHDRRRRDELQAIQALWRQYRLASAGS